MDPDFIFIVPYACPRCHAALEVRMSGPPAWLRCPICGRASLPPEHGKRAAPPIDDQTLVIGPFPDASSALPVRPRAMAPRPSPSSAKPSPLRLLLGTGFFLTTFLCLFALLEPDKGRAIVFGGAAAVFLILLVRREGPRPGD